MILKNFSKEDADKLQALISGPAPAAPQATSITLAPAPAPVSELTHYGVGTFHDPVDKLWKLAVLTYNPQTMEAKVEQIKICGQYRNFASDEFKIFAAKYDLI